jgi:hypothetical protein
MARRGDGRNPLLQTCASQRRSRPKTARLQDKIKKLREQMKQLDGTKEQLEKEPDGQRSIG